MCRERSAGRLWADVWMDLILSYICNPPSHNSTLNYRRLQAVNQFWYIFQFIIGKKVGLIFSRKLDYVYLNICHSMYMLHSIKESRSKIRIREGDIIFISIPNLNLNATIYRCILTIFTTLCFLPFLMFLIFSPLFFIFWGYGFY